MKNQYILIIGLFFLSTTVLAGAPAPPATPIDGGLSLLLALGGALGIKRIMVSKPKN